MRQPDGIKVRGKNIPRPIFEWSQAGEYLDIVQFSFFHISTFGFICNMSKMEIRLLMHLPIRKTCTK